VIPIEVPPLRERAEDIPLLVHHFLDVANQEKNKKVEGIGRAAMELLCAYDWPGNVRELENLMERLVVLCGEGEIRPEDLPPAFHRREPSGVSVPQLPASGLSFRNVVDDFETDLILQALEQTHWNKNKAARLLGLNRTTLLEKIKKKGLEQGARSEH
jgi:DNA-binding NtrC family response regulator